MPYLHVPQKTDNSWYLIFYQQKSSLQLEYAYRLWSQWIVTSPGSSLYEISAFLSAWFKLLGSQNQLLFVNCGFHLTSSDPEGSATKKKKEMMKAMYMIIWNYYSFILCIKIHPMSFIFTMKGIRAIKVLHKYPCHKEVMVE